MGAADFFNSCASLSWSKSLLNWFSLWWTYTSSYKDSCRFSLLSAGKSNTVWTFLMFSKTFFLHCTNVYYTWQSHPLFNGQRSTNGNNEPFQWNYQRSIINYCPRGGSMGHAASHSTTPHHTQQNTIALENIVGWDCSQIIWSKTILDSVGEPAPVFQIGQLWFVGLSCAYWAASARLHILLSCSMLLFFC